MQSCAFISDVCGLQLYNCCISNCHAQKIFPLHLLIKLHYFDKGNKNILPLQINHRVCYIIY